MSSPTPYSEQGQFWDHAHRLLRASFSRVLKPPVWGQSPSGPLSHCFTVTVLLRKQLLLISSLKLSRFSLCLFSCLATLQRACLHLLDGLLIGTGGGILFSRLIKPKYLSLSSGFLAGFGVWAGFFWNKLMFLRLLCPGKWGWNCPVCSEVIKENWWTNLQMKRVEQILLET